MGVRRVGKTSLCLSLPDTLYFDCETPRVRELFKDPENFLEAHRNKRVILDEIHRLDNPSEVLKIAADHYPDIKIIATGSSTLGASAKFKDTLTGRKREVWLTPLLLVELPAFSDDGLRHRLLHGGLPPYFTATALPESDFSEWTDAYWAKDIQELFRVGKRSSFQKFAELLLIQSGGLFEASKFAGPCQVTRQTIANYLAILEETFVVHVVRPFSTFRHTEIVAAPKVYGFDTGFVCFAKGWRDLRSEDLGLLWELCVLNELHAHLQRRNIHYWRDKSNHEIDFVLPNGRREEESVDAIECKVTSISTDKDRAAFKAMVNNFAAFRAVYPNGNNYVVASDIQVPFDRSYEGLKISFVSPSILIKLVLIR
jgi:predicted AAA+ superfamily ATPase